MAKTELTSIVLLGAGAGGVRSGERLGRSGSGAVETSAGIRVLAGSWRLDLRAVLGGALHLEVEIDLRAQAERHRIHRLQAAEFQWVRSRICWIVVLVVPTRRMICASFSSGWLRRSQRMAFGRSWRRETGV